MKKELVLNKGDIISLTGKEYEVIVVSNSQVTLKNEAGKSRRVTFKSPMYDKIELVTANKKSSETTPKKKVKRNAEDKVTEMVPSKPFNYLEFEKESFAKLKKINEDEEERFDWNKEDEMVIMSWVFSIQRASKPDRIAYIEAKLKEKGQNADLFKIILASYKMRDVIRLDLLEIEARALSGAEAVSERASKYDVKSVVKALKQIVNISPNKMKQEAIDSVICSVPASSFQGWIFYAMSGLMWHDWGNLKLSKQDMSSFSI